MKEFRAFVLRGNVVDLAVGVVIGAAFGEVVSSFVKGFLTPLIGIPMSKAGSLGERSFTLGGGEFLWGQFVDAAVVFVLVAAAVFFLVVKPVNHLMARFKTEPEVVSTTRECPECLSKVPVAARRCAFCTVELAAP
jgi:large conductance mechanosensitive channel